MPVPTLPGTHWPAPYGFFQFLDYGAEAVAYPLLLILGLVSSVYALTIFCCDSCSSCSCCSTSCWLQLLLKGSRILHVKMFPGLFKKHKTYDSLKSRENKRWVTREFILYLDRRVENNPRIIITFYIIAMTIFSLSLLAFFRFIPAHASEREICLKKDDKSRTLFCYTHESCTYSLPVDCDAYNSTNLNKGRTLICYTISVFDVGLALAAAAALTKVAIVGITIFILVNESLYKRSQDKTIKCCKPHFCQVYFLSYVLLRFINLASLAVFGSIVYTRVITPAEHQAKHAGIGYAFLPIALVPSLCTIICTLRKHCDQQEYISYSQQQLPYCKKCHDVLDKVSVSYKVGGNVEIGWGESSNEDGATTSETEDMVLYSCKRHNRAQEHTMDLCNKVLRQCRAC